MGRSWRAGVVGALILGFCFLSTEAQCQEQKARGKKKQEAAAQAEKTEKAEKAEKAEKKAKKAETEEGAESEMGSWVFKEPKSASDHYDMGHHYHQVKDYQMMLMEFSKVLQMRPGDYKAMNNVGAAYAYLGHYQLAKAMWERVLKIHPGDEFAKANLKRVREQLGEKEPAKKAAAKKAEPKAEAAAQ